MDHVGSLRAWLRHLYGTRRLMVLKEGISPRFEMGQNADAFQGHHAVLFPEPAGFDILVVAGGLGSRRWIAEAPGVAPEALLDAIEQATSAPVPWSEGPLGSSPTQQVVY